MKLQTRYAKMSALGYFRLGLFKHFRLLFRGMITYGVAADISSENKSAFKKVN